MSDRIKDVKFEFGSPWLKYFTIKHDKGEWNMVSRRDDPLCTTGEIKADAVSIAAIHQETDKVVITKEYRYPLGDYEYGIPAGLIDEGETIEQAARRELKEETGLEMTTILRVTPPLYSSAGMTDEAVATIFVRCKGEHTSENTEECEDIETLLLDGYELRDLMAQEGNKFGTRGYLSLLVMQGWEMF